MSIIKVSIINSSLHESGKFDINNQKFIDEIEKRINNKIVLTDLEDYDCDLKLIFVASGGSEGIFLKYYDKLKEPYYLLTSGNNNSLAASLEILTFLNNNNKSGEVIHGGYDYIASRILVLTNKKVLSFDRLGVIGKPSDWLISSIPVYEAIKNKFNLDLVDIKLDDVVDKFKKLALPNTYCTSDGFDKEELNKADKLYKAIDEVVKENNLSALTIRCFDLLSILKTTGCLALSNLNNRKIISACEGDIMALISMYLVKKWFDEPSFQANPSRIDVSTKEIVFAHCSIPTDMTTSFKYDTHFESGIGVAIKGELKEEPVTIFRLSADLKTYFVEEGKIIKNLNDANLCRTQILVKMNDLNSILTHPCGNHHIIFYGNHKRELLEHLKEYYEC